MRNQITPGMFAPQGPNAIMLWDGTTPKALAWGPEFYVQSNQLRVAAGSGTVTSVGLQPGSTGLTVTVGGGGGNPITSAGVFSLGGILNAPSGGTGISTYTTGDLLQAFNSSNLQRLQAVATGNALLSGGVGAVSFWGKIGLTTHVSGILPVANGGSNISTYAAGDLIYASATNTLSRLAATTNGFVLTLSGGFPVWAAVTGTGTVTSVDVSGLGTGMNFLGGPITSSGSITMTGVLNALSGGTGQSSYTIGDLLQATGATTLSKLSSVATGNVLISGGVATASSWGKVGLTTHVIGTLPVANGGTNITTYASGDLLYASATNTLSRLAKATDTYVLTLVAGFPAWAAPTGGGGGSVSSVALAGPSIFTVSGSPVTTSGTLTFSLATQTANTVWAGPVSGSAAAPTFRGLSLADLPAWVIEDIPTGSNYIFTAADNNKIKRFLDTTPRNNTIPAGLPSGWNCIIVRGPSAAVPTILSLGTYEGAGNTLDTPNTWAQIVHRGGNNHMAAGAFTGLLNSAGVNELAKSDGTNLVPSTIFVTATGIMSVPSGNIGLDAPSAVLIRGNNVAFGQPTGGSSGGPYISIAQRTANFPLSSGANVVLYGQDSSDNTVALSLYTEQVVEAIGTFTPTQKYKIQVNGLFYWISLDPVI